MKYFEAVKIASHGTDATDGGVVWDFMGCTRSLNAKPRSTAIRHSGLRLVHKLSRINGRRKDKIRFPSAGI